MDSNIILLVGIITGIIGSITGVISLIWHMVSNRSKLKLEYFSYGIFKENKGNTRGEGKEPAKIVSEILLKNQSDRHTSIEKIFATINRYLLSGPIVIENHLPCSLPFEINGNSSRKFELTFHLSKQEYQDIKKKINFRFSYDINHTFGKIKEHKIIR